VLLKLTALLVFLGAAVALWWLSITGGTATLQGYRVFPVYLVLMVAATLANVAVRFVRWQFLLRRVDVRIPERASLSIYLASLAAMATPAYAGEVIRPVLVRRRFGVPMARTLPVLVAERGFDALALTLIGAATAPDGVVRALMLGGAAALLLLLSMVAAFARRAPLTAPALVRLTARPVVITAAVMSLAAWIPAAWLVGLAAASLGEPLASSAGMQVFSRATLVGGLSLMPAGVGAMGSSAILGLQDLGLDLPTAVMVVSFVRATTAGLAVTVGIVFLVIALRRPRQAADDSVEHFDEIADVYSQQLTPHVRDLLVTRKTDLIARRLRDAGISGGRGLDVGCGMGAHARALAGHGHHLVGIEPSVNSVIRARQAATRVAAGSATALPFRDGTFDFVYTIGVLHHLPGAAARAQAYAEIVRVLRPGGWLLVHETNPLNPLFRFYMGYVFPMMRRIDEGTEEWLDPRRLDVPGMTRERIDYMTFLPDFVPRLLLPAFLKLEHSLEQSQRLRSYSVHYLATFVRQTSAPQRHLSESPDD
jgi:SAM-dependent methyltransferase